MLKKASRHRSEDDLIDSIIYNDKENIIVSKKNEKIYTNEMIKMGPLRTRNCDMKPNRLSYVSFNKLWLQNG